MKVSTCGTVAVLYIFLQLVQASIVARGTTDHPNPIEGDFGDELNRWPSAREGNMMKADLRRERRLTELISRGRADTLKVAGSKIPDCSHACGSCSPCRLVIVRYACAPRPTEAETCPVAYKCMCNGKSYPVP